MCVIICLEAKQNISFDHFKNACYNNEHGFGMVVEKNDDLICLRKFSKNGLNPKKLYDLQKEYINHTRYIHLRYATAGEVSQKNVHPFKIYEGKDNKVFFMHNGTLNRYKSTSTVKWVNNKRIEEKSRDESDSYIFAYEYLQPFVKEISNGSHNAYLGGSAFDLFVDGFWPEDVINRGLIISAREGAIFLSKGNWKVLDEEGNKIIVSNTDYFKELKRGSKYEEEKKKKEAESKLLPFRLEPDTKTIANKNEYEINKEVGLSREEICKLFDEYQIYCSDDIKYSAAILYEEWEVLIKEEPKLTASLLQYYTSHILTLEEELEKIVEKHENASRLISKLKKEKKYDVN